jgi:shikimate dehydrogenase
VIEKVVGLIGWPVSHSISPLIQNAAFRELGLEQWVYVPMPVSKYPYIRIKEAVLGLRALGFQGANVTVPYKEAVVPYLEQLSEMAKAIGAVNTIVVDSEGRLIGHNTDGLGFIKDLSEHQIDVSNMDVLLLGAGGSARSVAHALLDQGCPRLTILNRTKTKAEDIANGLAHLFPRAQLFTGALHKDTIKQLPHAELVINATTMGMLPSSELMPWDENVSFTKNQVVYDLIYNPYRTKLLKKAEADGARAINGLGMLVHQGALAFKIWTGHEAPVEVMKAAAEAALGWPSPH